MRSCLILSVVLLFLSGCVTETSSVTRNNPSAKNTVNNQDAAKTRIALALQYLNAGNTTQAKFNLERAASFAPKLPEVHYALAYYYEQVDEKQWAKKAYLTALSLNPNDPNALNNYGTFLCRIGEYDEASEQLLKAINIPSYLRVAQSYENLALCAVKQDKFPLALEYLESAVQHNGRRPSALIGLAALFYAKSDLHQAENVLKVYRERGFMSARALLLEHLLHQRMGHLQQAQTLSDTLIQNYPSSRQASLILRDELNRSEFEKLKEQYRQAQVKEITATNMTHVVSEPKIKITRKKAQTLTKLDTVNNAPENTVASSVSLRNDVNKFTPSSRSMGIISQDEPQILTAKPISTDTALVAAEVGDTATEDEVRVISFGETTKRDASAGSTVKFYTPDPTEVVFSQPRAINARAAGGGTATVQNSVVQSQLPLLNADLSAPSVPFHVVKVAENLFSLSVKYDIKMAKLLVWNNLKASDRVSAGQKVFLNNPQITHNIRSDDTLFDIATLHGLQIDDLMRWNKLTPDVALTEGHSLLIVDPNSYVL
ncbi:type IV pilus assembly protein PilF [Pseudoalteromonas citrea]|uniref:Type IV pilus assembly protein PilF n=2 Tax=Pseudoalteromonas citrea TaxID=43655 RepID=A0AAD4AGW6_9GAMM|nr:type IV pilus biogenesis/stability protein PilW [Pseudoalteromonas citrea]KAF7768802.1 type IV pilus assembly protein PilF [Pseudoalteromonas citrea]